MSNRAKIWVIFTIIFLIISVSTINFFIWPFRADSPNFSDVDKAFNQINVPASWKLRSITENKGTAGRTCPIESSGCFSKRGLYALPETIDVSSFTEFLTSAGCKSITTSDTSTKNKKAYTFYCQLKDGIKLGSDYRVNDREATVRVFTE